MLPVNQLLSTLSQDDYNDYIEFQNFKKIKYSQQLKLAAATNQVFNFLSNPTSLNSIFPSSSATNPSIATTMASNFLASQQQHHQQQQQQQQQQHSPQIIPKVIPQGMPPLQLIQQHQLRQQQLQQQQPSTAAAPSFLNYKSIPNFPGLKGGASHYQTSMSCASIMPPSMPIQTLTPKVATPMTPIKRAAPPPPAASPEIIVDDTEVPEKKAKPIYTPEYRFPSLSSASQNIRRGSSPLIPTLPSIDSSTPINLTSSTASSIPQLPSIPASSTSTPSDFGDETHIIITARPRIPDSTDRESAYTTEDDSDYDTNLRPKETPLQYKERMMVRVLDKAKRKNEASKRSREKRKREHQDRQVEKHRLEKRNSELSEKLTNLKDALKRLRPQICSSCNDQVQKFLDQCQSSKEGMNVFVLRPCKQEKCPGSKSVPREIGKFATSKNLL